MKETPIGFNYKIKTQLDLFKIKPSNNKELRVFCSNQYIPIILFIVLYNFMIILIMLHYN